MFSDLEATGPGAQHLSLFFGDREPLRHESISDSSSYIRIRAEAPSSDLDFDTDANLGDWIESLIGRTIGERYLVRDCIATGGMGVVLDCEDAATGLDVALKLMRPDIRTDEPMLVRRFARECEAARLVCSEGVPHVYQVGHDKYAGTFIAMEQVQGETLTRVVRRRECLSVEEVVLMAEQLTRTLADLRSVGIVHRDIKPGNVLVSGEGEDLRVLLIDFGICRFLATEHHDDELTEELTTPGVLVGTLGYMAPEQMVDSSAISPSTDTWAAGAVLYFALTGVHPYDGAQNAMDLFEDKALGPPIPAEHYRPEVPVELSLLISEMMSARTTLRPDHHSIMVRLDSDMEAVDDCLVRLDRVELDESGSIALSSDDDPFEIDVELDEIDEDELPTIVSKYPAGVAPVRKISPAQAFQRRRNRYLETYVMSTRRSARAGHWVRSAAAVIALGVVTAAVYLLV